jgi:hypothetical protein
VMSFRLWLRQIAQDRIIDAHRRHRISARRSVDREQAIAAPKGYDQSSIQLAGMLSDQNLTPEAAALQQEMARRVEAAVARLTEFKQTGTLATLLLSLSSVSHSFCSTSYSKRVWRSHRAHKKWSSSLSGVHSRLTLSRHSNSYLQFFASC